MQRNSFDAGSLKVTYNEADKSAEGTIELKNAVGRFKAKFMGTGRTIAFAAMNEASRVASIPPDPKTILTKIFRIRWEDWP